MARTRCGLVPAALGVAVLTAEALLPRAREESFATRFFTARFFLLLDFVFLMANRRTNISQAGSAQRGSYDVERRKSNALRNAFPRWLSRFFSSRESSAKVLLRSGKKKMGS